MNDEELIWEAYVSGTSPDPKKEMIQQIMQNGNINETDAERLLDHYLTYTGYRVDNQPIIALDPNTNTYKLKDEKYTDWITSSNIINFSINQLKKDYDVNEFYHAGPKLLKVKDIEFDRGALGFHIGKKELVDSISKKVGYFYDRKNMSRISKFGVVRVCDRLEIEEIEEDLPWEEPIHLIVYLFFVGLYNKIDAINLLEHFGYQDNRDLEEFDENDMDFEDSLFAALDNIEKHHERSNSDYHPVEDLGVTIHPSEFYKNKEALEHIRKFLIECGYSGIQYPNEAEGRFIGNNHISICVLDKCILRDIQ
jgi:hypothetical protein